MRKTSFFGLIILLSNVNHTIASETMNRINNDMTIERVSGDFIALGAPSNSPYGGAIHNIGTINIIEGDFINNYANGSIPEGGAIWNSGTINSIKGNFIGNSIDIRRNVNQGGNSAFPYGGAIFNKGTISSLSGDFSNNITTYNSGDVRYNIATGNAISNDKNGRITLVDSVRFLTWSDTVYNDGVIATKSDTSVPMVLELQRVYGSGSISLNDYTDAYFFDSVEQDGVYISQNSTLNTSADYLEKIKRITNEGKICLSDGTWTINHIDPYNPDYDSSGNITGIIGNGTLVIAGDIISNVKIGQDIIINNGKSLTVSIDNIKSVDLINNGVLWISGGTLDSQISKYGDVRNIGELYTKADYIDKAFVNNGTLFINSGTIAYNVTGSGQTHIIGNVYNGTDWSTQPLVIDSHGHFTSDADKLSANVVNNGFLTIGSGTLNAGISGVGTTILDGTVIAEAFEGIHNNIQINKLSSLTASNLRGSYIKNDGVLYVKSGLLNPYIEGTGITEILGAVQAKSRINQDVIIHKNATLDALADAFTTNVQNDGILKLNSGTLSQNISGQGQIVVLGNVINEHLIEQPVAINTSGSLTTGFDSIIPEITNYGNLILTSGTINKNINGNGTITIVGNVHNLSDVDHKINIMSEGVLLSTADKLKKNITNNGMLYLDGGNLSGDIIGEDGYLYISNNVTISGDITQKSIEVSSDKELNIAGDRLNSNILGAGATNILSNVDIIKDKLNLNNVTITKVGSLNLNNYELTTQDLTLNGTLLLEINNVSKDSSDYTGGHLIVDGNLTYGDNSKLQLLVGSGLSQRQHTGELELITVNGQASGSFSEIVANNLYSVEQRNGKYIISYGPTINDVVEIGGGNDNNKATANAWDRIENPTGLTKELQSVLNYLLQYDEENYVKGLDNLAPSDSNFVAGIARTTNTTMAQQIAKRLSDVRGRSGGDVTFKDMSVWAQGLYNMAEQDGDATFNSKTFGVMAGIDGNITDNLTVGVGYAYNKTNADADEREVKANGSTVSLYGEYVHNFDRTIDKEKGLDEVYKNKQYLEGVYVNAAISYGSTDYEEESEMGNFADYTVSSIGANANVGLALTGTKFVPEVGVRYLHINKYDYQDAAEQEINVDAADILTLVANAKYSTSFDVNMLTSEQNTRSLSLKPFGHIGVSYDVLNSDNVANVSIANVQYQIQGESIDPLGVSAGLGIETSFWGFDWQFGYDLEWHSNFTSHTGKIRAKYVF